MKLAELSLVELAAYVSEHLKTHGIEIVVIGGSAITSWVPAVYTSYDIDFAAIGGDTRKRIAAAFQQIGFQQKGRMFVHPECTYTVDFVATTPHIDRRAITEFASIENRFGTVRVLKPEDAIADRVAAWVHWSDSESLAVAERAAKALKNRIARNEVDECLGLLLPADAPSALRLKRARERIGALLQ